MPAENPRRKRTRRRRSTPPRYKSGPKKGQFRPRKRNARRKKATTKRRRRNLSLLTMNAGGASKMKKRTRRKSVKRRRTYRRRRNPAMPKTMKLFGFKLPDFVTVGWAVAGAAGTQALPNLVMAEQNAKGGVVSYGLELASAIAISTLAKMLGGTKAGAAALTGGGVRLVWHMLDDFGVLDKVPGLSGYPGLGPGAGAATEIGAFLPAGGGATYFPGQSVRRFGVDMTPSYLAGDY